MVRHPTSASERLGRYRLISRIGSGGMAEVFRVAVDGEALPRSFVLKRMRPELAHRADVVAAFAVEARVALEAIHPHIARALELVDDGQHRALVFDHAPGADLLKLLGVATREGRRLPLPVVVAIVARVAGALGYLHRLALPGLGHGWAHRDVSPSNIVISHEGDVRLIDLGVVHPLDGPAVHQPRRGKVGYLAPETILNGSVGAASDIFALATVLWEALTLRRLFRTGDDLETLRNIAGVRVEARFARHAFIPEGIMDVIRRGLAPNPADRHRDAEAFEGELLRWLAREGEAVSVRDIGAMCRDLVPTPFEEPVLTDAQPEVGDPLSLDFSALEAMIDAIDVVPPREGLERLVGRACAWLPPSVRSASDEVAFGPSTDEHTSPEASFDLLAFEQRRADALERFDPWVFPALLVSLQHRRFSGVITVRSRNRQKRLHLQGGALVRITSNIESERLARRLELGGSIVAEARVRALALQKETGMRIGEALVAADPGCADAVAEALGSELVARLAELLGWAEGEISVESGSDAAAEVSPVLPGGSTESVVVEAVRAAWTRDEVATMLEPWFEHAASPLLPPWPEPPWIQKGERDAWFAFQAGTSLRSAARRHPREEVALLAYLGLVTLRQSLRPRPRTTGSFPVSRVPTNPELVH